MWKIQLHLLRRRSAASLLVILFAMAVTVFLLLYPQLIGETEARLADAYDSIDVSGWIINNEDYTDPVIEPALRDQLLESGLVGEHYTYARMYVSYLDKTQWGEVLAQLPEGMPEEELLDEFSDTLRSPTLTDWIYGVNRKDAQGSCARLCDQAVWLEGYDESCLGGDELVCLMPSYAGYQPGDTVPMQLTAFVKENPSGSLKGKKELMFKVVAVYPAQDVSGNTVGAYCPIRALEANLKWEIEIRSLIFSPADNREVGALKEALTGLGLDGSGDLRAIVDDRILKGTVAPIESNLSMLQGLYRFFFGVVAAIGFFLCFLLARGRKAEYAVMRMLGESTARVTVKALLEQLVLCAAGVLLGALAAGQGGGSLPTCAVILACYTLGAAVAVLLTVRVNVMEILRDKE